MTHTLTGAVEQLKDWLIESNGKEPAAPYKNLFLISPKIQPYLASGVLLGLFAEPRGGELCKIEPINKGAAVRVGRGLAWKVTLKDQTQLLLRHYRRGGALRLFLPRWYLGFKNFGATRMEREVQITEYLHARGVAVPRPFGCGMQFRFGFFYQGFILLEFVSGSENYLNLLVESRSADEKQRTVHWAEAAGKAARKMLECGVYHCDLHPGNVLVSPAGVSLIDFDKAYLISSSEDHARHQKRLIARWQRAVEKYSFAPEITAAFASGLEG